MSGFCDYLEGRFQNACTEFERYAEDKSLGELRRRLWHFYSLWGNGNQKEANALLEKFDRLFQGNEWEEKLLDFHVNRITADQLLSEAKNRLEKCEAFFYIGCRYRHEGKTGEADLFFRKAAETRAYHKFEYAGAKFRLKAPGNSNGKGS